MQHANPGRKRLSRKDVTWTSESYVLDYREGKEKHLGQAAALTRRGASVSTLGRTSHCQHPRVAFSLQGRYLFLTNEIRQWNYPFQDLNLQTDARQTNNLPRLQVCRRNLVQYLSFYV